MSAAYIYVHALTGIGDANLSVIRMAGRSHLSMTANGIVTGAWSDCDGTAHRLARKVLRSLGGSWRIGTWRVDHDKVEKVL